MGVVILYAAWFILLASVAAVYRALMLFERRAPLESAPGGEDEAQVGWWRRVNTAEVCAQVGGGLFAASAVGFVVHFAVEVAEVDVVTGTWNVSIDNATFKKSD